MLPGVAAARSGLPHAGTGMPLLPGISPRFLTPSFLSFLYMRARVCACTWQVQRQAGCDMRYSRQNLLLQLCPADAFAHTRNRPWDSGTWERASESALHCQVNTFIYMATRPHPILYMAGRSDRPSVRVRINTESGVADGIYRGYAFRHTRRWRRCPLSRRSSGSSGVLTQPSMELPASPRW